MWLSEIEKGLDIEKIKEILFRVPNDDFQAGDYLWVFGSMIDLEERVYHTILLYYEKRASKIILSGGNGEALRMKEIMVQAGIPENVILIETESKSTIENVLCTTLLLYRMGYLNTISHLVIVTSIVHMKRVLKVLEKYMCKGITFSYSFPKYSKYIDSKEEDQRIRNEFFELVQKIKDGYLLDEWIVL